MMPITPRTIFHIPHGISGANVTIAMANGQQFTLPIASLSAADQQYLKSLPATAAAPVATKATYKPSPNDKLPPTAVNEAIGQPLFSDTSLWESPAEELAQKLNIPSESKTKVASSFRSYTKDDYQMFGAHPFSVAMYAENDRVTSFTLVFANKGDLFSAKGGGEMHFDKDTPPAQAASIVRKAMDKDVAAISAALAKTLGEPKKERIGDSQSVRETMLRWDWRGHPPPLAPVPAPPGPSPPDAPVPPDAPSPPEPPLGWPAVSSPHPAASPASSSVNSTGVEGR